jgi:hypothetical protein
MESLIEKLGSSLPGKSLKLGKTVKRLELSKRVDLMTEDGTMMMRWCNNRVSLK